MVLHVYAMLEALKILATTVISKVILNVDPVENLPHESFFNVEN